MTRYNKSSKPKSPKPGDEPLVRPYTYAPDNAEEAPILRERLWWGWETTYGWRASFDRLTIVLFARREDLEAWIAENRVKRACCNMHWRTVEAAANADAWLAKRRALAEEVVR